MPVNINEIMKDVQSENDTRKIPLQKVGVKNVKYPITVLDKTHKGCPSLLRSDSMLKAIGKSINIRVSGETSCHIPIVVLGNTPITKGYEHKADYLKTSGVVQGFWSLNPAPCDDDDYVKETAQQGFITVQDERMLENLVDSVKPLYTIFLLYTNH